MAAKFGKIAVGGLAGTAGAGLATYLLLNDHNENVSHFDLITEQVVTLFERHL